MLHLFRWSPRAIPALALATSASTPIGIAHVEQDFEQLIHLHERDVFGYLWRMTGDEQAAYDLSQETFLRAWRHFARVAAYDQPRAWLFRVATRLALNYRRDRRANPLPVDLMEADAQRLVAHDPTARLVEREAIEAALLSLPKRMRAALILRDVYGYRSAEIARVLDVSPAAAKMTISRAREQFRAHYFDEEAGQ
ncbi:MAG TPA: sigma-70 family RNA polymerase sigma factor [Ktedonobacterales bacterium]